MDVEGVGAAARAVRWFLPELVGPAAAEDMDARIADLLARASSDGDIAGRLEAVLQQRHETAAFLKAVVADAPKYRPPQARPQQVAGRGAYQGLPGRVGPMAAPKFRCPVGDDFDWWQLSVDETVPRCPTHACVLVQAR